MFAPGALAGESPVTPKVFLLLFNQCCIMVLLSLSFGAHMFSYEIQVSFKGTLNTKNTQKPSSLNILLPFDILGRKV